MKFEDILMMQRSREQHRRLDLEEEVAELQEMLEAEQNLSRVLRCAMHGPLVCRSCLSSFIPLQVRVLLAEIAMVEEEIIYLERKVKDLKLHLHQEREQHEWDLQHRWQHQHMHFLCDQKDILESPNSQYTETRGYSPKRDIYAPPQLVAETSNIPCRTTSDKEDEHSRCCNEPNQHYWLPHEETSNDPPNKLSEQLIKILISIFHKLHKSSAQHVYDEDIIPRLNIACISSRSLVSRSSYNHMLDPYGILQEGERTARDIGAYKKFIHVTGSSLDMSRITLCAKAIGRLRQAFLQHGLPPSPDKLIELLNKAAFNVGGIVLNALAIEHFILRPFTDRKNGATEEKERLLRHVYGLGYPEPNVTFALCRGSWSSPALRVYTAENVVNELERAKVEYLEVSIGITSKKKIVVPKLLHWHMRDFADDIGSLVEWTYSQLPRTGTLKRMIMECLSGDTKAPLAKMVEIQPYEAEFRYLLPF